MSEFLRHENCPNCGSRDNLGVYTDHTYCFGCGWYNSQKAAPSLSWGRKQLQNSGVKSLPLDFNHDIPEVGLKWLYQFIGHDEIRANHIGWSDGGFIFGEDKLYAPCLIFPVYDIYGNLLLWQARYFGSEKSYPKYFTRGAKDVIHILGKGGKLVLVEDMVSAIKISKVARAIPLFGASINLDLLVRLHRLTDEFYIWLDEDKQKEAQKFQKRANQFFRQVGVISTPLDPKCYSYAELGTIIGCG